MITFHHIAKHIVIKILILFIQETSTYNLENLTLTMKTKVA